MENGPLICFKAGTLSLCSCCVQRGKQRVLKGKQRQNCDEIKMLFAFLKEAATAEPHKLLLTGLEAQCGQFGYFMTRTNAAAFFFLSFYYTLFWGTMSGHM